MATVFALVLLLGAFVATRRLWPWRLNPMPLFVLAWTPAIIFTTIQFDFIHATYSLLNNGVGLLTYFTIMFAFIAFCLGVLVARNAFGRKWQHRTQATAIAMSNDNRLWQLFAIGLAVFVYSFAQSGLVDQFNLDPEEVFESRLALHLGILSYAVIFLDVTSTVFAAKFMETKRKIYLIPFAVTLICYAATLQKSRMMFITFSAVFIFFLYPRESKEMLFGSFTRKVISLSAVLGIVLLLLLMNAMRGIGLVRYTDFESPATEQIFIYSGATAIINLANAIEGHVTFDPPTYGLVLARPIVWHFIDRDFINPTKYFEGINASTFLIYPWSDFRWFGMILVPFLTGLLITVYFRMALRRTILGLMLGVIGFSAIVYSVNTDVIFDPTTLVILIVSLFVNAYAGRRHQSAGPTLTVLP
jgi:oligosaccharide repeat unit polymerase